MNHYLQQLNACIHKPYRRIIGLMAGTSLDGLDIALCKITGEGLRTKLKVEQFVTVPYEKALREKLKQVFAQRQVDLQQVTLLHALLGRWYAKMILETLNRWKVIPTEIDCIASHGQTVYHAPQRHHQLKDAPNATLQLADADHIAHLTGIITLSDFRQKHIAAGGEGAPLALYGDYLLFSEASKDRILLNIGGIANFTLLPATKQTARPPVSTDVGPGNTLIDAAVQHYFPEQNFDTEGYIARRGTCHPFLLKELLQHPFFKQDIPKTTGQEMFPWAYVKQAQALSKSLQITPEDLLCTLTHFTVEGIYQHLLAYLTPQTEILASGGGVHNTFLMELLQQKIASSIIKPLDSLGVTADAKEAALFAVLANETICGSSVNITPTIPSIFMGKISLP